MANKIKYGLKNVHYAVIESMTDDGVPTYGTPVAFPGAVSLSLDAQGSTNPFYADNIVYWTGVANNGYEGDFEVARVIDSFETDVLGVQIDENGARVELSSTQPKRFALMFQFEGDESATRHVMYNCTVTRPQVSGQTVEDQVQPQTETLNLVATTVFNESYDDNIVKAKATADSAAYDGWFTAVHIPTKASGI